MEYNKDGDNLLSCSDESTFKIWSNQGKLLASHTMLGVRFLSAKYSPDQKIIATAGSDKVIRLWNYN